MSPSRIHTAGSAPDGDRPGESLRCCRTRRQTHGSCSGRLFSCAPQNGWIHSALAEEIVVHVVFSFEFVGEFAIDAREQLTAFLLEVISLERPLGLSLHIQRLQIPRPQMLTAGHDAARDNARLFQRFFHMRADRRNGTESGAVVDDEDLDPIDLEFPDGILGHVAWLADAPPGHAPSLVIATTLLCRDETARKSRARHGRPQIGQCEPLSRRRFSSRTSRVRKLGLPFSRVNVSRYLPTRNSRLSPASMCELIPSNMF